ncbi:hypothetical protein H0J91_004547 [Salmonella enterica]|nr:hypothetical protein [Salmonella enterica]EFT8513315.1 hypothetical protein [Salmonella enterica]
MALDKAGGFYCQHISAMTSEQLHSKSDIAAELGHRDMIINDLSVALQQLVEIYDCTDGRVWTTSSKRRALDAAHAAIKKALGE